MLGVLADSHYTSGDWFEFTIEPIRQVTIDALEPMPGELLWDVGAGSGAVANEWVLRGGRAICIESDHRTAELIERNQVPCNLVIDRIEHCWRDLPQPHAIFHGCPSLTEPDMFNAFWGVLPSGGRLVSNVTERGWGRLLGALAVMGGSVTDISHLKPPVRRFQYRAVK